MVASDIPLQAATDALARRLPTRSYIIHNYDGYFAFTGASTTVYCIESRLGASISRAGYSTYAFAQCFSPDYPSLVLTFVADLQDSDRQPCLPAHIDRRIDTPLSTIFLPVLFKAFNDLDPTGQGRGLIVQSYYSSMSLGDLVHGSLYTLQLIARFKRDGQLAIIAVDFADPILLAMSSIIRVGSWLLGGDIYLYPRTATTSTIKMPVQDLQGEIFSIHGSSTALDAGLMLASRIFSTHYQRVSQP
jgi:hypothetical protein